MKSFLKVTQISLAFLWIAAPSLAYAIEGRCWSWDSWPCATSYDFTCPPTCWTGKEFIAVDLLYWHASQGGLSSTCDHTKAVNQTDIRGRLISRLEGRGEDPDFDWDWGYRLGGGFDFACWDFALFWTHFNSKSSGSEKAVNHNNWHLDLNYVDLIAGYKMDLAQCFQLRPYIGLRGAKISQHSKSQFVNTVEQEHLINTATIIGRDRERFAGVGPLLGLEGNWTIGCGYNFFVAGDAGVMYGNSRVRVTNVEIFDTTTNFSQLKDFQRNPQFFVDAALGLSWTYCFCSNTQLTLFLGLEHHTFFNQNHFCHYGDLNLDGGTFSASLEF